MLAPVAGLFAWQAWRLAGTGGGVEIAPLAVWHANFFWGAYAANYLLFVESAVLLAAAPRYWRTTVAWALLAAHAGAGLVDAGLIVAG